MLDIVFVNPGDRKVVFQDLGKDLTAIEPPYLTLTFATYLQNKGFNVKIIDANALNITPEETAKIVKELNPRLVALIVYGNQPSASTQNMSIAGKIAKTIKMTISLPIVMGGLHPSALPKRTLEEESVDFVIQGEEQIPLEQLLIALQEETSFETVESLWYYDNEVIKNSTKGKLINNLDDYMPIANWDLLPMDKYRAHNWHCFDDIDKNTKILISVLQSSKTIEEDLKSKGFSNILSFANSIRLLPEFINILSKRNYLWLVEDKKRLPD